MTLKEAMGKTMVLLDEVTSHNLTQNMEDYVYKLYPLFDSVQRELSTLCKPIEKEVMVTAEGGQLAQPGDCYEALGLYTDGLAVGYEKFGKVLFVPDGTYTLKYHAYPDEITKDTPDDYVFQIDEDAQEVMLYGVCAGICINDEPELYNTYLDRYNTGMMNILQRLQQNATAMVKGGLRL